MIGCVRQLGTASNRVGAEAVATIEAVLLVAAGLDLNAPPPAAPVHDEVIALGIAPRLGYSQSAGDSAVQERGLGLIPEASRIYWTGGPFKPSFWLEWGSSTTRTECSHRLFAFARRSLRLDLYGSSRPADATTAGPSTPEPIAFAPICSDCGARIQEINIPTQAKRRLEWATRAMIGVPPDRLSLPTLLLCELERSPFHSVPKGRIL